MSPRTPSDSPLRRWLWFVGLWAAGVGVTAMVGLVIKLWLNG